MAVPRWGDVSIGTGCSIKALAHIGQRETMGPPIRIAYIADDCSLGARVFVGPAAVVLNDKFHRPATGSGTGLHRDDAIGGNATVILGNDVGLKRAVGAVDQNPSRGRGLGRKPRRVLDDTRRVRCKTRGPS